jgi:chromosome segregation ATPase
MEFREYATTESTALIRRVLTARSEQARKELATFRKALDAAAQAAEKALGTANSADAESELAGLVERLAALASAHTEAATARVSSEAQKTIDAVRKELAQQTSRAEQLTTSLNEARARTETLGAELQAEKQSAETARDELKAAEASLQKAEAALQKQIDTQNAIGRELQEARSALDALRAESASVNRQLETEAAERAKLAAAFGAAQDQLQAAESQRQAFATQLAAATTRAEAAEHANVDRERSRRDVEAKLEAAGKVEATLRKQLAEAEAAVAKLRSDAESVAQTARQSAVELEWAAANTETLRLEHAKEMREQVTQAALLPLDRLLTAFQKLATATSADGILTMLIEILSNDFPRVALFGVNGNRLEGRHQVGFAFEHDISKIVVPLGMDSLLARAVKSCRVQSVSASELSDGSRTLFGGAPTSVLVVPIAVRRQAMAVIYADDSGQPQNDVVTPERKAKFAQLLLWQAVPRLPKLMTERKAAAEA